MCTLPPSIERELELAYQRTNEFVRLEVARERITNLLAMGPVLAERWMCYNYQRMDSPITGQESAEVECVFTE